jgi:undecaprenyl-diphosphatase
LIPLWQAAVLGTVQGLTEFLPVSSSAHLVLVPWAFNWGTLQNEMAFDVALHFGTLAAIILYFFFDWLLIVASYIGDVRQGKWAGGAKGSLLPKVILATIPAAVAGALYEERIEAFFYSDARNVWILCVTLAAFGLMLLLGDHFGRKDRDLSRLGYRDAILIGCAQAFALVPGVSRSGVTIFAGLLLCLDRPAAARFSFLLATPITLGAVIMKAKDLHAGDWNLSLLAGVSASMVVGLIAIKFLMRYVQNRPYSIFAYYRWLLAAAVAGLYYARFRGLA